MQLFSSEALVQSSLTCGRGFARSGLATLSDLKTPLWRELFDILEHQQADFLAYESLFRSPSYKWPSDALHNWSRVWEYPYVYENLKRWLLVHNTCEPIIVADIGSGVTFFPFSIARLGCRSICSDIDPVCEI